MEEKNISEMTVIEILRQQLELLAERSKVCDDECLAGITASMISLYSVLSSSDFSV